MPLKTLTRVTVLLAAAATPLAARASPPQHPLVVRPLTAARPASAQAALARAAHAGAADSAARPLRVLVLDDAGAVRYAGTLEDPRGAPRPAPAPYAVDPVHGGT